ncbi:carbohydrate kinase family protein [Ochrobactrum sp. BTU1]|uniref:carbohydrate kinase family protein n=1 Tax=Ochrobactrum sp. BTU1 TaxID=2840456 RepID=UPI001C048324|nr:sugar kinase [Ochrobactrum sp. BTU1]
MATEFDVSLCGSYILDICGFPVTDIPAGGSVSFIDEISMTVAGTAGGTAVPCARLGLKSQAFGAVGNDEKGGWILNSLHMESIDTSHMQRLNDVQTSATILPIRPDGSRPAIHARGASAHWVMSSEAQAAAIKSKVVHLGGVNSIIAMQGEPSLKLLKAAKAAGCITTLDLISARSDTWALVEPLLPYVDFFMPSIDEASVMVGADDPETCARFFLSKGVGACAISLGASGSYFLNKAGRQFALPAFAVDVKDTSGCGDSYTGGFIAGLMRDWDLEDCAKLATATSAIVATGLGSGANLVSFEKTVDAMNSLPILRK